MADAIGITGNIESGSSSLQVSQIVNHRVHETGSYNLKIADLVQLGTSSDILHTYFSVPLMWVVIHSLDMSANNYGYTSVAIELDEEGTYSDALFRFEYSHTTVTGSDRSFNIIPDQLPELTITSRSIVLGVLNCITRNATFESVDFSIYQLIMK